MRATEHDRRDWTVIALILLFGLLALLLAGRWALRFTPHWQLDVNVESKLDPNSDFLTRKPERFIEPVDPSILTNPAWIDNFLTPGASSSTGTQIPVNANDTRATPTVGTSAAPQTVSPTSLASTTGTALALPSPTNTSMFFPVSASSTPKPKAVSTSTSVSASSTSTATRTSTATSASIASSTPSPTLTLTATSTATATSTSTATSIFTNTPTDTATPTFTSTPIPTFTNTPADTPTTPPYCNTTITITGTSGSYSKPGGSTCFVYTDTFANGGIFQLTSPAGTGVNGTVDGSSCASLSISNGSTMNYGVEQSGGVMMFRITGTAGTVDINISDWTTYPACP